MNKDNYVTLPVAQRLVEKGIKVTVEAWWCHNRGGNWYLLEDPNSKKFDEVVPAPNMSELWRELPYKVMLKKLNPYSWVWLDGIDDSCQHSQPPCDALAELLIWVKEQIGGKK
jgi:hypothetical protein